MSDYTKTTNFAAKDSLPSGNSGKIVKGSEIDTEFTNIQTAVATKLNTNNGALTGTTTFETISDGSIAITAFVDEDNMSSNSATLVPTQQSVKAYVDSQVTAQDLDFQADSGGALSIDLDSETLTFTGGTGIDTSGSGNAVTFAIDSTVATLTGSQTLTNKSLTAPTLTGTAVVASLDISGDIDVDGTTNLDVVDIDGAVDMASTLAVAGVVTANAGVVVDNITIDGTEIDLSSGDLTLDVAGDINLDAGGDSIIFKSGGTHFGDVTKSGSDLYINAVISDGDIYIRGNDGGSTINALSFDMSAAGAATFNDKITAVGTSVFTNLDISGDIDVDGTTNLDAVDIDGAVDMASTLTLADDLTVDSGTLFVDVSANRVGVNTTAPAYDLDVDSTIHIGNDGGSGFTHSRMIFDSNGAARGTGNFFHNQANDVEWFAGNPYNAADSFAITRNATASHADATSNVANALMSVDSAGNVLIGGTSTPSSSAGNLALFNGTAPSGSATNGIVLYAEDVSSSSELKVRDEAGNVTTLSPHNFELIPEGPSEDMAWSYFSERDGKRINVDMLKAIRVLEKLSGEQLVFEA
jgi:cytoskeletal protein CcmA (bactofilin family)